MAARGRSSPALVSADERFGLALCIETLQYLPEWREEGIIKDLAALAPVVVFSTAVPMQQWPAPGDPIERWQGRWPPLFSKHGFTVCDVVRQKFWDDPRVGWWYRQNVLVFTFSNELLLEREELRLLIEGVGRLSVVHPTSHRGETALAKGQIRQGREGIGVDQPFYRGVPCCAWPVRDRVHPGECRAKSRLSYQWLPASGTVHMQHFPEQDSIVIRAMGSRTISDWKARGLITENFSRLSFDRRLYHAWLASNKAYLSLNEGLSDFNIIDDLLNR